MRTIRLITTLSFVLLAAAPATASQLCVVPGSDIFIPCAEDAARPARTGARLNQRSQKRVGRSPGHQVPVAIWFC